jgi:hypothetical protein
MVCNVRIWKQEPCVLSVPDTVVILQQQFYEISIYNYMDQSNYRLQLTRVSNEGTTCHEISDGFRLWYALNYCIVSGIR